MNSAWDALVPDASKWHNTVGECATLRELVRDLRALADFLESRPDLPVPRHAYLPLNVFAGGTEADRRAQVDHVAALLRTTGESHGDHYLAEKAFGNVAYRYVAIPPSAERATSQDAAAALGVARRASPGRSGGPARGHRR